MASTHNGAVMTPAPDLTLPRGLPSTLFRDFLDGAPGAAPFFVPSGGLAALEQAARGALALERPRAALAEALVAQQLRRGARRAAEAAGRLRDPGSVAVVTGQQAVLFGGPLLVLYKALAVRRLARELEQRRGAPVVPVFWVASDDHDLAEVSQVELLDAAGALRSLRWAPAVEPAPLPAARVALDDSVVGLLDGLAAALPPSLGRDEALAALRQAYEPGRTLSEAFACWLSALLPDVVLLDPADASLRAQWLPVLRREIEERSPSTRLALETGARLEAAGYHQQVQVRPGFLNLFLVEEGQRRPLALEGDEIVVRGTSRRFTRAEALAELEARPLDWSPGALLRPLAQDLLLPTAAYVGGPAEIAYHAQIGPSYAAFGVPRPALVARPSLTLVEPPQLRALEAEGLALADLREDPAARLAQWARESQPEVEEAFARVRAAVEQEMAGLRRALQGLDPTLAAAAESSVGRVLHPVEGLRDKALKAMKRRDETRAARLLKARTAVFPAGEPQERRLGLLGLAARHGLGAAALVEPHVDPFSREHAVVTL